ncbi:MAG: hypothetical protein IPN46_06090 [Saprospiraceae bacterium]|nr:hypothetical protein [Saprospiraceae bacterium]
MNIYSLEERIECLEGSNYYPIIELIINAVREYPQYEMEDTNDYFEEVKRIVGTNKINYELINDYVLRNPGYGTENNIWVMSSLGSFLEAINLMNLYKITFEEIQQKIIELS